MCSMMLIFSRNSLSLLGGLIIIIDFATAGMVPIKSPGGPAHTGGRPAPVAKPINTPAASPNAHRPERPQTHPSILNNAQQPVSFGIVAQKPPAPPAGSYSSTQSSVANSQSHSIYTQNNVGAGGDPVMIISSTQNAVNETSENTHNVPMEQMAAIITSGLAASPENSPSTTLQENEEPVLESSQNEITQESLAEQSPSLPDIAQVSVSSMESSHNVGYVSVPNGSPEPIPVPYEPATSISNELPQSVSQESLGNDHSPSNNEQLPMTSQESSPPQSSPLQEVYPSAQSDSVSSHPSPVAQSSATNGIIQNSNIQNSGEQFNLEQYLAQANLALGGGSNDIPPEGQNEISEVVTADSQFVNTNNIEASSIDSLQLEGQNSSPVTSTDEIILPPEELQQTAESATENLEEPSISPLPISSGIDADEILGGNVIPEHVVNIESNVPVEPPIEHQPPAVISGEMYEIAAEQVIDHESSVEQITVPDNAVHNNFEQFPTVEQAEMSHETPPNLPDDQGQAEQIDSNSQSDPQTHVDNIDEQVLYSEVSEAANVSPVTSPDEIQHVVISPDLTETNEIHNPENSGSETFNTVQESPVEIIESPEVSINSVPVPTVEEAEGNEDDDPPFNVEQYLAQAALILGSSRYRPFVHKDSNNHMSVNELYYSNGYNSQTKSNENDKIDENLVNADQYYTHSQVSAEPTLSETVEDMSSDDRMSHRAQVPHDVLPASHVLYIVSQPLLPHHQSEQFDEDSLFILANPSGEEYGEDSDDDNSFSTSEVDQSLNHAEIESATNVEELEDSSFSSSNDIESSSMESVERARPHRPGFARPSAMGMAPVYTYSGGKLNTPLNDDTKLTHGSLSTANSKNQNGTFSMLHEIGKAPQHAMVSLLGSSAQNSYFNGTHNVTIPTTLSGPFIMGQKPSTPPAQAPGAAPPKVQHAVLNSTNIVGSLNASQHKPNDPAPTPYQSYYFPQDSVKFSALNNGAIQPHNSEISLIPQLESEAKSFQDDLKILPEQSVLDLLAQDRKKASGGSNHLVKRTATSASGKSLGKNATDNEKLEEKEDKNEAKSKVEHAKDNESKLQQLQAEQKLNVTELASATATTSEQKNETGNEVESAKKSNTSEQNDVSSAIPTDMKNVSVSIEKVSEQKLPVSNQSKSNDANAKDAAQNQQTLPTKNDISETSKIKQEEEESRTPQANKEQESPSRAPAPPSPKDAGQSGPSGPSLPQLPPAPALVALPSVPEAVSAPSLSQISIPEPMINTPDVPKDIPGMIGSVNIPPIPTLGDGSKSSNNKGLSAKPKPPKKPNLAPGKGNSQQGSNSASPPPQESAPVQQPIQAMVYNEPDKVAISEQVLEEEEEEEEESESDETNELLSTVSYNESNEDYMQQQGQNEQPYNGEKAFSPPKHGRPFPPGFATANPNPAFANPPHVPPFQNSPAPPATPNTNTAPEKECSCSGKNTNNNPNINNSGGKNNGNENNGGGKNNAGSDNGGSGKNPVSNDNGGGGKTPGKNNNAASYTAPAPAPTSAPKPIPVIDEESIIEDAEPNARPPPRPTKPKRPSRPLGGNKKPKPKPSIEKNSDKLKDVAVEDDVIDPHNILQQNMGNITNNEPDHQETDNKLETGTSLLIGNTSASAAPVKQTEPLISMVNVFGWEIPIINWSYFTEIFQSYFVEKFRTSSGEFTCDESDNEVTILRSELDVDYLCGDDLDYGRRDIRENLDSNICNMFCNSNGFSSGLCMPQKSCLCYMSEKKNFAIKLDRLQDYNSNSTEKVASESEGACEKCRCLKNCQSHGIYVGYCSKSCHCGVPWYTENPHQEVPAT